MWYWLDFAHAGVTTIWEIMRNVVGKHCATGSEKCVVAAVLFGLYNVESRREIEYV